MSFHPEDIDYVTQEDSKVVLGIKGTKSWREGEHVNEKNSIKEVCLSLEKARKLAKYLEETAEEIE